MQNEKIYKINEIFYSIQGEGFYSGRAAIFVRFALCNLQCSFCDTDFAAYQPYSGEAILQALQQYPQCKFVVLTGGEPTLQVDQSLVDLLHSHGYYLSMETNGTRPVPKGIDWVTCSPKEAYEPKGKVTLTTANEVKVVFDGKHPVSDFGIQAQAYYLQPCDVGNDAQNKIILQDTLYYIAQHPRWMLSLQLHKILNVR